MSSTLTNSTVIVGYSGSATSEEAVAWAASEASVRGAALRIVTCVEMPVVSGEAALGWNSGAAYEAIREASAATSAAMSARVATEHPLLHVSADVVPGGTSGALMGDATANDLIVVGASGTDGVAAFFLGTIPRQLVHNSPCPVVVVRGAASRGAPDRIVVGIDGSTTSDEAVVWAADEADRHKVDLVLVHGWSYAYAPVDAHATEAADIARVDADNILVRSVEIARERAGCTVTGQLVESSPVDALLESVQDGDLLVLGSHGRGGIRARLLGSTVNSVLDSAAVPVVVVRPAAD